jgi:mannose-6-phosphate isomerase-like protein (cupin superfamily)
VDKGDEEAEVAAGDCVAIALGTPHTHDDTVMTGR